MDEVLCMRELRTVGKDWCVRYENRYLQIDAQHESGALAGKRVAVLQLADGTLQLRRQGLSLRFKELATAPVTPSPPKRSLAARTPWRPGPDHPWKRVPVVVG